LQRTTPLQAFGARIKAGPTIPLPRTDFRVRRDHVDAAGRVTLRYHSRLLHIGVGRAYMHQPVTLLVADQDVRIVTDDGTLIRQLTLDPSRDYRRMK
jgi:hypothetical protein